MFRFVLSCMTDNKNQWDGACVFKLLLGSPLVHFNYQFVCTYLLTPITPSVPVNKGPPEHSITGFLLNLRPAVSHFLAVSQEISPPGIFRPASIPPPLWVPGPSLSADVGCCFPKHVSHPIPSSSSYFVHGCLVRPHPQILV